jgi:steroid delta-isomerase-like uncharacterized protein
MANDKEQMVRKYLDSWVAKKWPELKQLLADDAEYEEESTGRRARGPDEIIQLTSGWQKAFPDVKGTLKSVTVSGDRAVAEIEWTGTHKGSLETPMGTLPPSNKRGRLLAVQVFQFDGDKISEMRHYFDLLTLLTQIGAMPQAPQPAAP